MTGRKDLAMTIQDTVLTQIQYVNELTAAMKQVTVNDPTEEYLGLYWCGSQALATTKAFIDCLCSSGQLNPRHHCIFEKMIAKAEQDLVLQRNRFEVYRGC